MISIVSWGIANFGTLGSILGALGDHLAPFEEPGGVWIWSQFSSGFWGWAWGPTGSKQPTQRKVNWTLPGRLTATSKMQDAGYKLQNAVYKPAGYKDAKEAKDAGYKMHRIQDTGYRIEQMLRSLVAPSRGAGG